MPNSRVVDYNIFYDSNYGPVSISFPNLTRNSNITSKVIHLQKITIWFRVLVCEIPGRIEEFINKISTILDNNGIFINYESLQEFFAFVTYSSSTESSQNDEVPRVYYNAVDDFYYVTSLSDFLNAILSNDIILDSRIQRNIFQFRCLTTCQQLATLLERFFFKSETGQYLNLRAVFDKIDKYLCAIVQILDCAPASLVTIRNDFVNLLSITQKISELVKNQYQILFDELPAFAAARYLIAQLDFNQNNVINDTHVYTNNPNFQINSNQLVVPCQYITKGCEGRDVEIRCPPLGTTSSTTAIERICNLPSDLCEGINNIKVIEFNFGFPYWTNTFQIIISI